MQSSLWYWWYEDHPICYKMLNGTPSFCLLLSPPDESCYIQ